MIHCWCVNTTRAFVRKWTFVVPNVVVVMVVGSQHVAVGQSAVTFHGLGDLDGGDVASYAAAVSGDGTTIVGVSASATGRVAYRWTLADGMVALNTPAVGEPRRFDLTEHDSGGFQSEALGVSSDGRFVVGRCRWGFETVAVRWSKLGDVEVLKWPTGSWEASSASLVSDDGQIAFGGAVQMVNRKCDVVMWAVGEARLIGSRINGDESFLMGMTDDGSVIGVCFGQGPFEWSQADGLRPLWPEVDWSRQTKSWPLAVSPGGRAIAGVQEINGSQQMFCWHEDRGWCVAESARSGGADDLFFPDGVSADGRRVVGRRYQKGANRAFVWNVGEGIRDLMTILRSEGIAGIDGWILEEAVGVSSDGRIIVGNGINPSGDREAWWVELAAPPAPVQNVEPKQTEGRAKKPFPRLGEKE